MKTTLILTAAMMGGIALPTLALADAAPVFPGAEATNCDPAQFTPIFGKNGDVLYWNNLTCAYAGSGGTGYELPEAPEVETPVVETPVEEPPVEDDEVAEDPVDEPVTDAKA